MAELVALISSCFSVKSITAHWLKMFLLVPVLFCYAQQVHPFINLFHKDWSCLCICLSHRHRHRHCHRHRYRHRHRHHHHDHHHCYPNVIVIEFVIVTHMQWLDQ